MALSDERREQLEDIDPSWCPSWPVEWQRASHLTRMHLEAGRPLPTEPGEVVHQGEDLGRWVHSVRLGWNNLTTVQQWMCEQVLGIEPATEDEKPKPRRTQADKWALDQSKPAHPLLSTTTAPGQPRSPASGWSGRPRKERRDGRTRGRTACRTPYGGTPAPGPSRRWSRLAS
ncbi:hypothetical protein ACOZCG_25455 [Streptomyces pseudogriseolus]|uniref:hypothetical protein n=1 Tax=Streptomyces pseudogriseolus TaxID=36817 RepID=UPI003FA2CCC4